MMKPSKSKLKSKPKSKLKAKSKSKPKAINLKDYTPPDFLIDSVFLFFDLHEDVTYVKAAIDIKRNPQVKSHSKPLVLNGEEMELKSVMINGELLKKNQYRVDSEHLTIPKVPNHFILETEVAIKPQLNTHLTGLYKSSGNFCTQCESHGFRRITYFLDRPDVMTKFTTTIAADKTLYPLMLSNGNLIEKKDLSDNRHWVKWEDPSLKPSYLFALVAGDLDWLEDKYVTTSGRSVTLRVYVEKGKKDQAHFAVESLKRAMQWDEKTYGREYDLDIYMIVAVSDFNMGAMENKGLNLFNDRYILAKPATATDDDYLNIESVIGHEYFHNWTGNRITCRDWFQITLKEGLTIFRDQNFTADLHSKEVKRISDVGVIRTAQFAQDAGPMAHPIRPDSYIEVNNFYTVTVYNKGAEVIRMIETMIGKEQFRKGMDLYFKHYDGHAVTVEEFIKSFEQAAGINLKQFRRWYTQAGTPVLDVTDKYDPKKGIYTLTIKQSCPPTPGQRKKLEFQIPFAIGLLDSRTGEDLLLPKTMILNVNKKVNQFKFGDIFTRPIPSLLRNFSAPVKLRYSYDDNDLLFLMSHDSDGFNRWDAGQQLASKIIFQLVADYRKKKSLHLDPAFVVACGKLLQDGKIDRELLAQMLMLPRMSFLIEQMPIADIEALHEVREFVKTELAKQLHDLFAENYRKYFQNENYFFNAEQVGRRSVKNLCLNYLMQLSQTDTRRACLSQFQQSDNMTDVMGAMGALMNTDCSERTQAFDEFYKKWQKESLVLDKWFSLQALSSLPNTLNVVKNLINHPAFTYKNPNRVRALIGSFAQGNFIHFHNRKGTGYKFLADQVIKIDKLNPQLAARLIEPLIRWRKFDKMRQKLMRAQLQRIARVPKLSKDVYEIASKSLK